MFQHCRDRREKARTTLVLHGRYLISIIQAPDQHILHQPKSRDTKSLDFTSDVLLSAVVMQSWTLQSWTLRLHTDGRMEGNTFNPGKWFQLCRTPHWIFHMHTLALLDKNPAARTAGAVAVSFLFANASQNRFHEGLSVGSSTTVAIILQAGEGVGVDGLMWQTEHGLFPGIDLGSGESWCKALRLFHILFHGVWKKRGAKCIF